MDPFYNEKCQAFLLNHIGIATIKSGSPAKTGGAIKYLCENGFKSEYKEGDVAHAAGLILENLDLGIETLGRSVCRAALKVVGNGSATVLHIGSIFLCQFLGGLGENCYLYEQLTA